MTVRKRNRTAKPRKGSTEDESALVTGIKQTGLPDVVDETAVWTYGRDHGFAVWMRELLDDPLELQNGVRTAEK